MNITKYNALEEYEQYEILFDCGVLLLDRCDEKHSYLLYQIEDFYVEIRHQLNADAITGLRTFKSTNLLQPFLDTMEIDLTEIF